MRLLTDVQTRFLTKAAVLGLATLLAACGRGGTDIAPMASASDRPAVETAYGPEVDYPLVVGEAYNVGDTVYTPSDTLNFDEVGHVTLDRDAGTSVSIAHKTLPLPSYVEITSLDSGQTILARAERRGPMNNKHIAAMSPAALAQLGVTEGASVRIRRTNPPESDRAQLRMGKAAQVRMDTPASLLKVLKRKLPAGGSATLAVANPKFGPRTATTPAPITAARKPAAGSKPKELPAIAKKSPAPVATAPSAPAVAPAKLATAASFAGAFSKKPRVVTDYPLPPMSGTASVARKAPVPVVVSKVAPRPAPIRVTRNVVPSAASSASTASRPAVAAPTPAADGAFVVQAAAFSSKANAQRAANSLDGFVQKSGRFFRVRTGPFTNRGQAEAALAKVRAAGYSDARVFTSG